MTHTLDYKIGTALESIALLENLTTYIPTPQAKYRGGSERVKLASGLVRDYGWPQAEWIFPILTLAQRDELRSWCDETSEIVYIRTTTDVDDLGYKTFKAVMVWPEEEDIRAEMVFDLTIRFQFMIEQEEPGA